MRTFPRPWRARGHTQTLGPRKNERLGPRAGAPELGPVARTGRPCYVICWPALGDTRPLARAALALARAPFTFRARACRNRPPRPPDLSRPNKRHLRGLFLRAAPAPAARLAPPATAGQDIREAARREIRARGCCACLFVESSLRRADVGVSERMREMGRFGKLWGDVR